MVSRGDAERRLILVTGPPRSGTTPVGARLAKARSTRQLYEPLNFHAGDRRVRTYFPIPGADSFSARDALAFVGDLRELNLSLRSGVFGADSDLRKVVKKVTGGRTKLTYRVAKWSPRFETLVWKDPFASFWIELLLETRSVDDVLVTYRPALAVAASFQRLGWHFDVAALTQRYTEAFGPLPRQLDAFFRDADLKDCALNGAYVWSLIYSRVIERIDECILLDSGYMAQSTDRYIPLYCKLGLTPRAVTPGVLRPKLRRRWTNSPSYGARAHTRHRDLSQVNRYWRDILPDRTVSLVCEYSAALEDRLREHLWRP